MNNRYAEIAAENGKTFRAYVTTHREERKPGLIVCAEAFGVNSHMRALADRYAAMGFTVIVPDVFWRIEPDMELPYTEEGLKRASENLALFDRDHGVADIRRTIDALRAMPECNGKVGIIGFCIGGALAYLAAARLGVDACVSYYGKGIEDHLDEADKVNCPSVLHYGGADRFIPEHVVARVRSSLAHKPNIRIFSYPGVDHGFNSEDRKAYHAEAARIAAERTNLVLDTLKV